MKLGQIRQEAIKETPIDFAKRAAQQAKLSLAKFPYAHDFRVRSANVKDVEKELDAEKIPCYPIADDTISIAPTYQELLIHESGR